MANFQQFFYQLVREIFTVSTTLFKVLIPAIICVKILEELGLVYYIGLAISPLMQWVGLPESMGLVWATTIFTNIYAGLIILANTPLDTPLTIAQVSILGTMMLLAHALPVEAAIARKAGISLWITLLVRVGGGLLLGILLNVLYSSGDYFATPAHSLLHFEVSTDTSLVGWAKDQIVGLFIILAVISVLLFTLKILRILRIEKLIAIALRPFLKVLGISQQATSLTLIGITLGLSFGGGLLINEAQNGKIAARDVFTSIMLLNLLHSLIEDTLLILMIGADFYTIFWGRLIFAVSVIFIMTRLLDLLSEENRQRFFYRSVVKNSPG
ncbi:hypothetical protein OW491_02000 [Neptunomonas sp. CHC150]|uniref:nucleoside recognition domain-containing protein n=1 Tax=Neptunomonas TaxID=75687 RepID=UPI0025B1ADC4|nr:nucleoside recognition domain-containing protein [Neptunomonas sp. CHC150]MDN2658572.1 hypothetical protein [Neptunomonas sp. CHC150]